MKSISFTNNGKSATPEKQLEVLDLVRSLEVKQPPSPNLLSDPKEAKLLDGVWCVKCIATFYVPWSYFSDGVLAGITWLTSNLSNAIFNGVLGTCITLHQVIPKRLQMVNETDFQTHGSHKMSKMKLQQNLST